MAQSPLAGLVLFGNMLTTDGGKSSALNLTAATVVKAAAGRLAKVIVLSGGTAANGQFTFNDAATIAGAAAANQFLVIPSGTAVGTIYSVQIPVTNGIVLSAVPTAGSPVVAVSFS